jgi:uncharacterized membrane protein YbhN (UPF0104 family)
MMAPADVRASKAGSGSGGHRTVAADVLYRPATLQPFRRRPADGVKLATALMLLGVCIAAVDHRFDLEQDLSRAVRDLPASFRDVFEAIYAGGALWIVLVTVLLAVVARRRRLARDLTVAGLVAWGASWLVDVLAGGGESFPAMQVAVITALMCTAAPYLVRPLRRLGGVGLVVVLVGGLYVGEGRPLSLVAGFVLGWAITAAVHLAFGAPAGRPTPGRVARALEGLGFEVPDLVVGPEENGVTTMVGHDCSGRCVHVKVLGRDELHAGLLARTWRWVMFKDANPAFFVTRVQQLEREAYVMLLAQRASVPVADLLTVGAAPDAAVLAERRPTSRVRRLSDLDGAAVTDAVVYGLWAAVRGLRSARIAHGALNGDNVLVDAHGGVTIVDFGASVAPAPDNRLGRDVAEALITTALAVGPERAVAAAKRGLGVEALAPALRFVQEPALTYATNRRLRGNRKLLGAIRDAGAAATGEEAPKLEQLRRIEMRNLVMAGLTALAISSLLSAIGDPVEVYYQIREASWGWVLLAALMSALTNVTDAVAALGAIRQRVLLSPTIELQVAGYFTGLAAPGSLGTMAMTTRFFQKRGVPTAAAVSSSMLAGTAGTIVQLVLVTVCAAIVGSRFEPGETGSGGGGGNWGGWILVAVVVVAVAVGVVRRVPSLRERLVRPFREALSNLREVLRSPSKVVQLVGGNLGSQLLYALCLGACLHAFGESLPLATLVLVNSAASLLNGVSPVPGGLGVVEAGLVAGLTAAGIPADVAVPTALTHRLVTAWITPVFGWFALRNLEQRGEI